MASDVITPANNFKNSRRNLGDDYNSLEDIVSEASQPDDGKKRPRRNVRFTRTVKVHYVDDDGHLSTEDEDMCEEPKETYRTFYMGRARGGRIARGTRRTISFPGAGDSCDDYEQLAEELNNKYGVEVAGRLMIGSTADNSPSPPKSDVNITFVRDVSSGALTLKLVLHLGTDYKADDVLVRANMRGNVLRVVSNTKTSDDVTATQSANQLAPVDKRYELPVDVDPYQVRAKMDTAGNLTIEAPLMTSVQRERKNTLP